MGPTSNNNELKEAIKSWNQAAIEKSLEQKGIKWTFHTPAGPHMSGTWERLVKSCKRALKAIIGVGCVNDHTLRTLFTEVEAMMNSRPLTAVSDDPKDLQPLTPNHLLVQRRVMALPPGLFVKEDNYSRRRWRQSQFLANQYWKRWMKEYIPTLQERQKWHRATRDVAVNDLVLLAEDNVPRGKWPMARVVSVFLGRDGRVRSVELKTATSVLTRPVVKLCMLEESSV